MILFRDKREIVGVCCTVDVVTKREFIEGEMKTLERKSILG